MSSKQLARTFFNESIAKLVGLLIKLDTRVGKTSDFAKLNICPDLLLNKETLNLIKPQINLTPPTETVEIPVDNIVLAKEKKDKKPQKNAKNDSQINNAFNELDLRVGKVVEIKNLENSEKIYELKVDLGEDNLRIIGCGLRHYGVSMEEFTKENIVVFSNLKEKKLAGRHII